VHDPPVNILRESYLTLIGISPHMRRINDSLPNSESITLRMIDVARLCGI
jgi:hypothetical protein